jgi:hypothetical protein
MNNLCNSKELLAQDSGSHFDCPERHSDIPSLDDFLVSAMIKNRSSHLRFSDEDWEKLTKLIESSRRRSGSIVWKKVKQQLDRSYGTIFNKIKSKYYRLRRKLQLERSESLREKASEDETSGEHESHNFE